MRREGRSRGNGNAHVSPTVLSRYRHVSHESNVFPLWKDATFPECILYRMDVCGTRKPRLDMRGSGGPSDLLCDPYFRGYPRNMKSNRSSGLFVAWTTALRTLLRDIEFTGRLCVWAKRRGG